VTLLNAEPALALPEAHRPLAELLALMIERAGTEHFSAELAMDDASWVGYRLAELLPLPLPIKQGMLEINDSEVRLKLLAQFLKQQRLL
jgi:Lon protease-like protein